MIYKEEVKDLFSVPKYFYLAHCISADFGMGKGIATEFNKRFNMKQKLQNKYPDYINEWHRRKWSFNCILEDGVFNLITKERYFHKPTYDSLYGALNLMKFIAVQKGITRIAMPIIGCGLDKLQWDKVSEIIKKIFNDTDIEILVCKQ
jgi:O-acetyl-ADP-ribose deacetylase (regulator of RNase III)